jgi:hypothetical protein
VSEGDHKIRFEAEVIRFDGPGGWHGVFLPPDAVAEARFFGRANALGAIAVQAKVGATRSRPRSFPTSAGIAFSCHSRPTCAA